MEYYAKEILCEQVKHRQMLKKIPNNFISLPIVYNKISEEEYNNYLLQGYREEFPPLKFSYFESNDKQAQKFYELYNYYYTKWIYYLIKNGHVTYEWFKIDQDNIIFPRDLENLFESDTSNQFLRESLNDHKKLGRDVLSQGMYFPFFFWRKEEKFDYKKIIRLGSHRLYSLTLIPEECQNKEFLALYFPMDWSLGYRKAYMNYTTKEDLPCYLFNQSRFQLYEQPNSRDFYNIEYFIYFSEQIAPGMFYHKEYISPNLIWNDKKAFEKFINNPFPINLKLEEKHSIKI